MQAVASSGLPLVSHCEPLTELRTYIAANQTFIPDYGDRYRHDEKISTAFAESTVNYVVSKRFVKNQQMRWTQRGAHLLLQTRVQILNDDLRKTFARWFPEMRAEEPAALKEAASRPHPQEWRAHLAELMAEECRVDRRRGQRSR
ncbi:hypothetical protein R75461_07548 [Paraburkholderia nemoris]|nr:hypothetical protein [Paraburkholderia aspalathi]MBK5122114.1 hypothetical protein [Burkholderia sp. R-69980]CAE6852538.1 hypothetical protein R75461_07548 [Paraburkholderia nemoris]